MERGLSSLSPIWRNWPTTIARQISIRSAQAIHWSAQSAARISSDISRVLVSPKVYPSHRPCPVCQDKTFYVASRTTIFTGLYTRTCSACGYCDPKKVKMIKQL
jgi:hypothetical protein